MPTTVNINSTYVGSDSGQFVSPVLLAGRTLAVPGVTIKQNINYRGRITKLELSSILKDATCAWDPTGTVDIDEVWLEVTHLEVNLELCKDDFIPDFIGSEMGCNDPLPEDFLTYLLGQIGATVAESLEVMIWTGPGTANTFLGFEPKFVADGDVVKVTVPIAPAAATIIAEVRRAIALADPAVIGKSDLLLYVSTTSYQAIVQANNDKSGASPCGEDCIAVDGVTIFLAPGMNAGAMALAQKSNMFFGTWNTSDKQNVAVRDMGDMLERNMRFAMCFFAGVEYAVGAEIVYYPPA